MSVNEELPYVLVTRSIAIPMTEQDCNAVITQMVESRDIIVIDGICLMVSGVLAILSIDAYEACNRLEVYHGCPSL